PDHLHRMGVERHQNRVRPEVAAEFNRRVHEDAMTPVESVEHPEGHGGTAVGDHDLVEGPPQLHGDHLTPARHSPAGRMTTTGAARRPDSDTSAATDRKSTRLDSSHVSTPYAPYCL